MLLSLLVKFKFDLTDLGLLWILWTCRAAHSEKRQANEQMANNAQVANEGTQRCGNDSKTYTDDRIGAAETPS